MKTIRKEDVLMAITKNLDRINSYGWEKDGEK